MALATEDMEKCMKVIVVGNGGVGKSSMVRQYTAGKYTENYRKTIGVDFLEKEITVPSFHNEEIKIMLWDTAGQEEFDNITSGYYKDASACVLAFSITDRASFNNIRSWNQKVDKVCPDILKVLVENKVDLGGEAQVSNQEVENLAKELQVKCYRASVKDNMNINELFLGLAEEYLRRFEEKTKANATPAIRVVVTAEPTKPPPQNAVSPGLAATAPTSRKGVKSASKLQRPVSATTSAVNGKEGAGDVVGEDGSKKDCIIS